MTNVWKVEKKKKKKKVLLNEIKSWESESKREYWERK